MSRPPLPRGRLPAVLLALLALGACAEEAPPPPTVSGGRTEAARAPRSTAGPATDFDGRYVGTMTLNPDRTHLCRPAPEGEVEMTVVQGRGSFLVDPRVRQMLRGTVNTSGSVRLMALVDPSIATSGVFTDQGFIGEHRDGRCSYAVNLRRIR